MFNLQLPSLILPAAIQSLSQWTRTTGKALQDTAAKWWSAYKSFNLPWEEFCELFTNKFAGTGTILRLRTQLYSTKHQEREPVGIFLQKKYLLANRLRPGDTEEELVSLMLETIKPSIRRVIRSAFTVLVNRANQVEADDIEAIMKLYGTVSLDITIQGKSYPGEFLAHTTNQHGTTYRFKGGYQP